MLKRAHDVSLPAAALFIAWPRYRHAVVATGLKKPPHYDA